MAGPCSVESEAQILQTAQELAECAPISMLRGGVWKPRTMPGSFEGHGKPALEWLVKAGAAVGTPVCTEVANAEHAEAALKAGVDALWIGARTTVNPFYVQEIAEALRGTQIPVFIKNPIHAELNLWMGAIERFIKMGNDHVAAIHRGFFSTNKKVYRNEPKWHLSFDLRAAMPDLKIICDPSHIAGKRALVHEVSQTAMDLQLDGLIIESHAAPSEAWSDAAQQITPCEVGELTHHLHISEPLVNQSESPELSKLRLALDGLDDQLIELLKNRFDLIENIAQVKDKDGLSIFQMNRWVKLVTERTASAEQAGLNEDLIHEIFALLHKYSVDHQTELLKNK